MAAPLATAAAKAATWIAKKLAFDVLTDPEKILKLVLCIIGVILSLALFAFMPLYFAVNIPAVLISGTSKDPKVDAMFQNNLKLIAMYQAVPIRIESEIDDWVLDKQEEYKDKETEFIIDNKLEWQAVVAYDSVKYHQDFSKVGQNTILSSARQFVKKSMSIRRYTDKYKVKHKVYVFRVSMKTVPELLGEERYHSSEVTAGTLMYDFCMNFSLEQQQNIYDTIINPANLQEYPPGNANVIYYNQTDIRWAMEPYGTSTIWEGGCGPTALAMVVASLTDNKKITPKDVAQFSVNNGYRCEGAGSYWSLITEGGAHYGLTVTPVSRRNYRVIIEALSEGKVIIAAMGPGHFTSSGHFIVLRGLTDDKKILVNDPASVNRTNMEWDANIIINESSTAAGSSGAPFWIMEYE